MSVFGETYPVTSRALRRILMRQHQLCPECGGSMDVGYECNDCKFDGASEVFDSIVESATEQANRSSTTAKSS